MKNKNDRSAHVEIEVSNGGNLVVEKENQHSISPQFLPVL